MLLYNRYHSSSLELSSLTLKEDDMKSANTHKHIRIVYHDGLDLVPVFLGKTCGQISETKM